jgi:hypothetical protein
MSVKAANAPFSVVLIDCPSMIATEGASRRPVGSEFIKGWLANSQEPFTSTKEERLWLRRGIRPLLSGRPDEVIRQGKRGLVLDWKFGNFRVSDPVDNVQLSIYALLVSRDDDTIEEVTVQILSPHFDFQPFTYTRAELDQLYQSVLIVINSLADPGEPSPGAHCQFCPARLRVEQASRDGRLSRVPTTHRYS